MHFAFAVALASASGVLASKQLKTTRNNTKHRRTPHNTFAFSPAAG